MIDPKNRSSYQVGDSFVPKWLHFSFNANLQYDLKGKVDQIYLRRQCVNLPVAKVRKGQRVYHICADKFATVINGRIFHSLDGVNKDLSDVIYEK